MIRYVAAFTLCLIGLTSLAQRFDFNKTTYLNSQGKPVRTTTNYTQVYLIDSVAVFYSTDRQVLSYLQSDLKFDSTNVIVYRMTNYPIHKVRRYGDTSDIYYSVKYLSKTQGSQLVTFIFQPFTKDVSFLMLLTRSAGLMLHNKTNPLPKQKKR